MKHWVELSHIKKIPEPSGKAYGHQKPVEEIMGKTFIDPPSMIDARWEQDTRHRCQGLGHHRRALRPLHGVGCPAHLGP